MPPAASTIPILSGPRRTTSRILRAIEHRFIEIIRRHVAGDRHALGFSNPDGSFMDRESIMAKVHTMTEAWVREHRSKSLSEVVALGAGARAATLTLRTRRRTVGGRQRWRHPGRQRRPRADALELGEGRARRLARRPQRHDREMRFVLGQVLRVRMTVVGASARSTLSAQIRCAQSSIAAYTMSFNCPRKSNVVLGISCVMKMHSRSSFQSTQK